MKTESSKEKINSTNSLPLREKLEHLMKLYQTMYTGKVTLKSIEVMSLYSSAYETTCKLTYLSVLQVFYKFCVLA